MLKHLATDTGNLVEALYSGTPGKAQTRRASAKYELDKKILLDLKLQPGDWKPTCTPYWQEYIRRVSGGKVVVQTRSRETLQFFLVRDGAEGFLPPESPRGPGDPTPDPVNVIFDADSSHTILWNALGRNDTPQPEPYDASNALVITDARGDVVAHFQLLVSDRRRDYLDLGADPVTKEGKKLAEEGKVAPRGRGWDGRRVKMATAGRSDWNYPGLSVEDGDDYHADIHDFLGTHGCIQASPYAWKTGAFDADSFEHSSFCATYLPHWPKQDPLRPAGPLWLGVMRLVGF